MPHNTEMCNAQQNNSIWTMQTCLSSASEYAETPGNQPQGYQSLVRHLCGVGIAAGEPAGL